MAALISALSPHRATQNYISQTEKLRLKAPAFHHQRKSLRDIPEAIRSHPLNFMSILRHFIISSTLAQDNLSIKHRNSHCAMRSCASLLATPLLMVTLAVHPPVSAAPQHGADVMLAQAGGTVHLNDKCRRVTEGFGTWQVNYSRPFQSSGGEQYWFVIGQYGDGSSLLCVTKPGYAQGQRLALPQLQSHFIGQISQEGNSSSFLVDHQDGNGRAVLITRYRLSLANPSNPKLAQLKQWRQ